MSLFERGSFGVSCRLLDSCSDRTVEQSEFYQRNKIKSLLTEMTSNAEEHIRFLKAENKCLKNFNKELVNEVKELRSVSPVRDYPEDTDKTSPEKLEVDPSGKKELLVSSEAKSRI